jgi:hypothetical protein
MKYLVLILIFCVQVPVRAVEIDYILEFGVVLHDEFGSAVGFKETTNIPINKLGKNSLYGLIISKDSEESFTIGSVHILPQNPSNTKKIMGKTMVISGKGAVFMKTQRNDVPGNYEMELYINGILYETINYHLISEI